MTLTRRQIVELLDRHGVAPSRALGQNFVVDPNTVRRIVRVADIGPGDAVVEIGPGVGSLTTALVEAGAEVVAVELDRHLIDPLTEVVGPLGVRIVQGDALEVDWAALLAGRGRWRLVANLPYNVATTIVLHLLDEVPQVSSMVVMVQREVGERLVAEPGGRAYGIPSVKLSLWARAEIVARIPATVFLPQPRVESVLVRIVRRGGPAVDSDLDVLFSLVRQAFGQRRKMLRRSLAGRVSPEVFASAGIAPEARPEELGIDQWGVLTDALVAAGVSG